MSDPPEKKKTQEQKNDARRLLFPSLQKGRLTDSPSVTPDQSRTARERGKHRQNPNRPYRSPRQRGTLKEMFMGYEDLDADPEAYHNPYLASVDYNYPLGDDMQRYLDRINARDGKKQPLRPFHDVTRDQEGNVRFPADNRAPIVEDDSGDEAAPSPSPAQRAHGQEFDLVENNFPGIGGAAQTADDVWRSLRSDKVVYAHHLNSKSSSPETGVGPYPRGFSQHLPPKAPLPPAISPDKEPLRFFSPLASQPPPGQYGPFVVPGEYSKARDFPGLDPRDPFFEPASALGRQLGVPASTAKNILREDVTRKARVRIEGVHPDGPPRQGLEVRKRSRDELENVGTMAKMDVAREREIKKYWLASEQKSDEMSGESL